MSTDPARADDDLMEQLADAEHASWGHWMDYQFSRCEPLADGSLVIPAGLVERWRRQAATPYADLTEREKNSDRNEVRRVLPLIEASFDKRTRGGRA